MITVEFDFTDSALDHPPIDGVVYAVATRRRVEDTTIALPVPVPVTISNGLGSDDLPQDDGATWCWLFSERLGREVSQRYCTLSDQTDGSTVAYSDLTDVNPSDFEPLTPEQAVTLQELVDLASGFADDAEAEAFVAAQAAVDAGVAQVAAEAAAVQAPIDAAAAAQAVLASKADVSVQTTVESGRLSVSGLSDTIDTAIVGEAHTFTETQTFDVDEGFAIGPLKLSYVDGFFGQRLHLTSPTPGVMPYLEAVPSSTESTDVGKRLAGFQVYKTVGGGGVPDREFLAIESVSDAGSVPGFTIGTWASGTGEYMPLRINIGTANALTFQTDANIVIGSSKRLYFQDTDMTNPIILSSENAQLSAFQARHYLSSTTGPYMFLAKNRGTIAAPALPNLDDILGDYRVGSMDGTTEATGGGLRGFALQSWDATKHGSIITIRAVPKDTTSSQEMVAFSDAETDTQTAMLVTVNRSGTKSTRQRVTIGAADSGGTGFRLLRVVN